MLEFQRFDPAGCQFPPPRAALLPALNWAGLTFGRDDTTAPGVLAGAGVRHFSRGRYALAAAYKAAGVGPSGSLLAPAYHCRTMLDPALALGGAIHLYPLQADLTPDLAGIEALAARHPDVRAVVVPHYFGVAQQDAVMHALAEFCAAHGILLIEDCSHAWHLAASRAPACQGGTGHLLVGSPYKFFACADGGTLWGHPSQLPPAQPSRQPLLAEAKALKAAVVQCMAGTPSLRDAAPAISGDRGAQLRESSDQPSALYSRALEGVGSLALSRWVMRRTRLGPAVQRRRAHYRAWAEAVAGLRGGRALFPDLPDDCVPYMFPLLVSAPETVFFDLKQAGMPIWRWDEMAVSACPVAAHYRLHLLHLPCHQGLASAQLQWMTATVAKALA